MPELSDADAAEVLVVLGQSLDWICSHPQDASSDLLAFIESGLCFYRVCMEESFTWDHDWNEVAPRRKYYTAQFVHSGDKNDVEYGSQAEAKAACERHHATGRWEG